MMTAEDNELLTRVGPGTPMGEMMRRYWIPARLSSELAEPGGDPQRIRLLGEDLIVFRDTDGRVGLLAERCAHRCASLYYGRNEAGGLRCIYHGWKYDVGGRCVEMPNEPPESNFKDKVRQLAYPCGEAGGMIWAYMGPRREPPPLPDFEWLHVPESQRRVLPCVRRCNWLQGLEGDIDTSHFYFLHGRLHAEEPASYGVWHAVRNPWLEIVPTEYGAVYGSGRQEEPGVTYWRITQFLLPFHALFPGYPDGRVPSHIWVPIDDGQTLVWSLEWNPLRPLAPAREQSLVGGFLPPTPEGDGRWQPIENRANDYGQDRAAQRAHSFTGIPTIFLQDQAVTESMGSVCDRTQEHLGASDAMIILVRNRLLKAAEALRDAGTVPPGVDHPEWYRVRSTTATLAAGASWLEELRPWLDARTDRVPELRQVVASDGRGRP